MSWLPSAASIGDELHKAPDVKLEDASRRKTENARRTSLDISPANYRPRPELGTDAVAGKAVHTSLTKATTDLACRKSVGSGEWCMITSSYTMLSAYDNLTRQPHKKHSC